MLLIWCHCLSLFKGFRRVEECHGENMQTKCEKCKNGEFVDSANYDVTCKKCNKCKGKQMRLKSNHAHFLVDHSCNLWLEACGHTRGFALSYAGKLQLNNSALTSFLLS